MLKQQGMCTSLIKTLNIENLSNPYVERLLALGGGVTLYSKGFQPYFQINCHSELDSESYQFVRFLNNIFNYSYVLFFFLSYEARKKKSTKRKKKHVFEKIASLVLTELGNGIISRHCGLDPQSHKPVVSITNTKSSSPNGVNEHSSPSGEVRWGSVNHAQPVVLTLSKEERCKE